MKRHRVGASHRNSPSWPGLLTAVHKGAELVRKEGGNWFSITCYTPGIPRYSIDSWDGVNSKRTNEESVWMGKRYYGSFEGLPKFWVKYPKG